MAARSVSRADGATNLWIIEMDGDRVLAVTGWIRLAEPVGGADADVLAVEATPV